MNNWKEEGKNSKLTMLDSFFHSFTWTHGAALTWPFFSTHKIKLSLFRRQTNTLSCHIWWVMFRCCPSMCWVRHHIIHFFHKGVTSQLHLIVTVVPFVWAVCRSVSVMPRNLSLATLTKSDHQINVPLLYF